MQKYLYTCLLLVALSFIALSTTSCNKKYGCPTMEEVDLNKAPKKSTSGLATPGDKRNGKGNYHKNKKKKKNRK